MLLFRKFWHALFPGNTRFEIRLFALLQTRCSSFSLVFIGFKYFFKISEIVIPLLRFLFQSGDGADMLHVAPIITLTLLSIALRLWGKSRSARLHNSLQPPANNCNWGLIWTCVIILTVVAYMFLLSKKAFNSELSSGSQ